MKISMRGDPLVSSDYSSLPGSGCLGKIVQKTNSCLCSMSPYLT